MRVFFFPPCKKRLSPPSVAQAGLDLSQSSLVCLLIAAFAGVCRYTWPKICVKKQTDKYINKKDGGFRSTMNQSNNSDIRYQLNILQFTSDTLRLGKLHLIDKSVNHTRLPSVSGANHMLLKLQTQGPQLPHRT